MKTLILSAVMMMAATAGATDATPAVSCRLENDRILQSKDGSINETIGSNTLEVSTLADSVMVKVTDDKKGKVVLVAMGKEYVIAATEKISISCKVQK